jgi:trigger factor
MQFTVESISSLEKKVLITIAHAELDKRVEANLEEISKTAKLPGFRVNKAPKSVVAQHYGERALEHAINDIVRESVHEVVTKEKIHVIAAPKVDVEQTQPELKFSATFEIYPEIGTLNIDLHLSDIEVTVSEEDVDVEISRIQSEHIEWEETDVEAADKNQVNLDFVGTVKGEEFQGSSAKGVDIVIGSKSMIDGFEEALVGLSAGDETVAKVTMPDNYANAPDFSGKEVEFAIVVNKVSNPRLPEVDLEFFKNIQIQAEDVQQARAQFKEVLQKNADKIATDKLKQQALEKLLMNNPVDVPLSMVDSEAKRQREYMVRQYMGKDVKVDVVPLDGFTKQAKQNAAIGLLLNSFIGQNSITATDTEIETAVTDYITAQGMPADMFAEVMENEQQRGNFASRVVEDKAIAYILESAEIVKQEQSYTQLLDADKDRQES